jgi:hypothetical protein
MSDRLTPSQKLWNEATSKSLRWPAPNRAEAHKRRFQLYNMRRNWRRAGDPFASIADLVEVVVKQDPQGNWWTHLQPKSFDLQELIGTAWVGNQPLIDPMPEAHESDEATAKILRRMEINDYIDKLTDANPNLSHMGLIALANSLGDTTLADFKARLAEGPAV